MLQIIKLLHEMTPALHDNFGQLDDKLSNIRDGIGLRVHLDSRDGRSAPPTDAERLDGIGLVQQWGQADALNQESPRVRAYDCLGRVRPDGIVKD